MLWRNGGAAALGGCLLLVALPYPNARTAVLLAALLVAAAVVAGSRVVTTGHRVTVLLLGLGAIGGLIKTRLDAFDMAVTPVRRSGADGARRVY